ncbi:hypothetical protein [Anaplasma phagocytophilum]
MHELLIAGGVLLRDDGRIFIINVEHSAYSGVVPEIAARGSL